jgi:hypothetical protein
MFTQKPQNFAEARKTIVKILTLPESATDDEVFSVIQKAIDKRDMKILKALEGKLGMIIKHFQEKDL